MSVRSDAAVRHYETARWKQLSFCTLCLTLNKQHGGASTHGLLTKVQGNIPVVLNRIREKTIFLFTKEHTETTKNTAI